jgi:uncharacterized membrane protein
MTSLPTPLPRLVRMRARLRPRQQGVAMLGVLTLMLALLFTVLAVDSARLWLQKRNLQKAADMAAMQAARFTGCGSTKADAVAAATQALQANAPDDTANTTGATVMVVQRGRITRDAQLLPVFTVDETENNNAAHIELTKPVRASLIMGGMFTAPVEMKAKATAQGGPPIGTFSVGSLVGVTDKSAKFITNVFKAILGNSSLNLTTQALTDLAGTTVSLAQLQVLAGAKTIEDLLTMKVPLSQLVQWIATASPSSAAANAALSQLITASASSGLTVKLGDVLSVHLPADTATASASLNVLDLLNVSLMVGKGAGVINLDAGIAGIGSIGLSLGQTPKIAIGPAGKSNSGAWCTQAQSSQVQLVIGINPLGIGIVDMALRVDLASVNAQLASLNVAPGATTGVLTAGSTLIDLRLTKKNDASKPASVLGGLLTVGLNLPVLSAQGGTATFKVVSHDDLPTGIKTTGTLGQSISGLLGEATSLDIKVLGIGGDLLKPLVQAVLIPIFKLVGDGLIDPLLSAIGLNPGFVLVQLQDVKTSLPKLRE